MTITLAAIADDYTGASDLANTWRKAGLRTVQTIGIPPETMQFSDVDALVISLKIRSVPSHEAINAARCADRYLRRIGVSHVMYKICSTFDSTDHGNIGQVTDALRQAANAMWTIVSPAFPETGRTVYKGHLFVENILLSDSPLKHHPLNPMHDANLVRVLMKQTQYPVRLLDLQTLYSGPDSCEAFLEYPTTEPCSVIVDTVLPADLHKIAALAIKSPVSTGASGLGYGLAHEVLKRKNHDADLRNLAKVGGYAAIIAGSCSARTLEQISVAEKYITTLKLSAEQLICSQEGINQAIAFAKEHLGQGPILIAASSTPDSVRETQSRYGSANAGAAIEAALAEIAEHLVGMGVRRLVVAGGETSGAIVDRLTIQSFEIGDELAPGVPALRTVNRQPNDLMMALKSGNFGGSDFFREAITSLQ